MGEKKVISIKEYAEIRNIKEQGIYQALKRKNSKYEKFLRLDDTGKKVFDISILDELGQDQKKDSKVDNLEQETSSKVIIDLLNDRIEEQKQELNVKNKQIEILQEQATNLQKLLAMEKQEKKALLEGGNEQNIGVVGHIKRLMFGKKSDKIEE